MTLSTHLLRRGIEAAHGMHGMMSAKDEGHGQPGDDHPGHVPALAALIFFVTAMSFIALLFGVSMPCLASSQLFL